MKRFVKFAIFSMIILAVMAISVSALSTSNWAIDYVDFCLNNDMFRDKTRTSITATQEIKRQEVAYALMKMEGHNWSIYAEPMFPDVVEPSYYNGAINWAASNGVMTGNSDGTFRAGEPIRKQDLVLTVYRYLLKYSVNKSSFKGYDGETINTTTRNKYLASKFSDYADISEYARDAVYELTLAGIITGNDSGAFEPLDSIPLIEAACIFTRAHGFRYILDETISVYVKTESGLSVANAAVVFCLRNSTNSYGNNTVYKMTDADGFASLNVGASSYAINTMSQYTSDFSTDYVSATKFHQIFSLPTNQYDYDLIASYNNNSRLDLWPHGMYSSCKEAQWAFPQWCPTALMDSGKNFGWRYNGRVEFHQGMDCGGYGETIVNTTDYDMKVVDFGTDVNSPYGVYCKVQLIGTNYFLVYQHLSVLSVGKGQTIYKDTTTQLGKTGNSGNVAAHLHLTLTTLDGDAKWPETVAQRNDFHDPRILFK